jgi:hypothetical protein
MCGKIVRIRASSRSNLKVHRDGSNMAGKLGSGCDRFQDAIAAGAKLLPMISQLCAQRLQQNQQGSLAAFVIPAPAFTN